MAKARDLPGKKRAINDTGRFKIKVKKNAMAINISGVRAHQTAAITAKNPRITNQKRMKVSVLTLNLTSLRNITFILA